MQIRLTNRDAIEEALRKEARESKKALEEVKATLANAEQALKEKLVIDEQSASHMRQPELEVAQAQIQSLTREVSSLKSAADHNSLVEQNKQLTHAVVELDKAIANSEKKVGFLRSSFFMSMSYWHISLR
jgi:hypothetical protein